MEVKIPFYTEFKERMLTGQKTATSRTRKFGNEGDTFGAFGATFKILSVTKMPLLNVKMCRYRAEGFDNPQAFETIWKRIHPRKGFTPYQDVYYHTFTLVSPLSKEKE